MDNEFLREALEMAERNKGFCYPNPSVGAVLVKDGKLIAKANHEGAGEPHAEAELFRLVHEDQLKGSTLYVTLEPCCHWGKTPPCTQLIIANRIKEVVYGYQDPNPKVGGQGISELKKAGIECRHVPMAEVDKFYESYAHWWRHGRPFVTAKLAVSMDGKTAGPQGQPAVISKGALNEFTHRMRKRSDAILTSVATLRKDNPKLNVRMQEGHFDKRLYVVDRLLRIPDELQIFSNTEKNTIFHGQGVSEKRRTLLVNEGIDCVAVSVQEEQIDLSDVLNEIGRQGVQDLWVEAGPTLFYSLVSQGLAQRCLIYMCTTWLGQKATGGFARDMNPIFSSAKRVQWIPVGRDSLCELTW